MLKSALRSGWLFSFLISSLFLMSCAHQTEPVYKTSLEYTKSKEFVPGRLVIIQGPTSDTETNINILSPRLKNYKYVVSDASGSEIATNKYDTLQPDVLHWKIDKIHIKNLKPNTRYTLKVIDEFRSSSTVADQRTFETLNVNSDTVSFSYASCMTDDYRFTEVINPMWAQMQKQNPDFIVLNGDIVYVDSFEFVERQKATELDIWQRFIDSFERIPLYHWKHLKPIFATWDDHDFGTNDGDRQFTGKQAARRVFLGFFGGQNIPGVYQLENDSVYFSLNAFNQRFLFLDNRYFRQPNKNQDKAETFAHWGEKQHNWAFSQLKDGTPAWLINGGQFFSGVDLTFKESIQSNNPEHFKRILADLKETKSPVVFASGDIHFSEIMKIPPDRTGYETYELTSSSMHSYTGTGWDNPLRLEGAFTREFNFMMIKSQSQNGKLKVDVTSWGLAKQPYFQKSFEVKR